MNHLKSLLKVAVVPVFMLGLSACAPFDANEEIPTGFVNPNVPAEENNAAEAPPPADENNVEPQQPPLSGLNAKIDPNGIVPKRPLEQALRFFEANKSRIKNQKYLTIFDVSKHSKDKRLFVIDMQTGQVARYWVAHGTGSDPNADGVATRFSNTHNSKMTSIGFYLTGGLYQGKYGTSMYLHGLESTNSNAYSRAVVMHGANYVSPSFLNANGRMGASWGCPAVEMKYRETMFPALKGGSVLYVYYNQ